MPVLSQQVKILESSDPNFYKQQYNHIILSAEEKEKQVRMMKERISFEKMMPVKQLSALDTEKAYFELRERLHVERTIVADYWKRVNTQQEVKTLTPRELHFIALKRYNDLTGKKFNFNRYNWRIFQMLVHYFAGSPQFEKFDSSFSLKKGLFVFGPTGCGKTTLLKCAFSLNQHASYVIKSCAEISHQYENSKDETALDYYSNIINISATSNPYRQTSIGVCFDDLGEERDRTKRFGNETNVMEHILKRRYDNVKFKYTHITSNLNADQIEDRYGNRLRSRFAEMFNLIEFDALAADFRKTGTKKQAITK